MGHTSGSFDYKVINPTIKQVLKARSELDNTTQVAMPFIKATTTIAIPEYLGVGRIGFTLGLHGIDEDVMYKDMFGGSNDSILDSTNDGSQYPLVGYTYDIGICQGTSCQGKPIRLYAKPPSPNVQAANLFFDQGNALEDTAQFGRIPPPGITQAVISNYKNGVLASGELTISVPHISQLEYLHRTFLIPGCGMVLEWGQQFAPEINPSFGEFFSPATDPTQTNQLQDYMFPWHDRIKLEQMIKRLRSKQVGIQEILDESVIPTRGQYMWMFGRIANFSTNARSDGSFECKVKIVGPSEDAWAYSARNTVIPATNKNNDICEANSIETFFAKTSPGKNLKTLLDDVFNDKRLPRWKDHVQVISQGNKSEGNKGEESTEEQKNNKKSEPNVSQTNFGESEDAYFMTWRFFVNVVVNHPEHGLRSIFADPNTGLTSEQLQRISLLRPYIDQTVEGETAVSVLKMDDPGRKEIDDPMESYVGFNTYLRSTDPSTLIIVNEAAAIEAENDLSQNRPKDAQSLTQDTKLVTKFRNAGDFDRSTTIASKIERGRTAPYIDRGFLSTGVWINHKAVVEALVGANTFLQGITNLLTRMNQATSSYWQLALDGRESPKSTINNPDISNTFNHTIVDVNWRGSSDEAVKTALGLTSDKEPGLYVFNKYVRRDKTTGKLVGSELIECNVDLSLPKRMFAQIATLGLVQKEDLQKVGVDSDAPEGKSALVSDANETLREMFAITTISPSMAGGQGPDLTLPPSNKGVPTGVCGKANSQVTANVAGNSQSLSKQTDESLKTDDPDDLKKKQEESKKWLEENSEACGKCSPSPTPTTTLVPPTIAPSRQEINSDICNVLSGKVQTVCKQAVAAGITEKTELAAFLGQVKVESGNFTRVEENLNYKSADRIYDIFRKQLPGGVQEAVPLVRNPEALANRVYANRIGNGNEASGDGYKYRGRGYIQLTGKENYSRYAKSTGVDVINNPNTLLNQTAAVDSAVWYWKTRVKPKVTNFTDARAVTRQINTALLELGERERYAAEFLQKFNQMGTAPPVPQVTPTPTQATATTTTVSDVCKQCQQHNTVIEQTTKVIEITDTLERTQREFPYFNKLFRYIEAFPEIMVGKIRGTADSDQANAFGAAPGSLSIKADLTLPGINGIRIGELFWIDRIPQFYKAFGAFQVMGVQHTIGPDGWKTQINSVFNYLGNAWKLSVTSLLQQAGVK